MHARTSPAAANESEVEVTSKRKGDAARVSRPPSSEENPQDPIQPHRTGETKSCRACHDFFNVSV
jgi:hypothetical protein